MVNEKLKEAIQRMLRGERSLYVKRIGEFIVIRRDIPKMLLSVVKTDLKKGGYKKVKAIRNRVIIFRRPL